MVISRTPFRISFFGGGTDYPAWYRQHGGAVLATTIDKYCYLTCRYLPPFFDHKYRIIWSKIEKCATLDEITHPAVREVLRHMGVGRGVEIHYDGDLPARSGMGSSSAFTVGLLNALHALQGRMRSKTMLARESMHFEQDVLKETVGSQDQVLAAHGGFNLVRFERDDRITVAPVTVPVARVRELAAHLMLFFTGIQRTASTIAASYVQDLDRKAESMQRMTALVGDAVEGLGSDRDIRFFGELLHQAWTIKRSLGAQISNPVVEAQYARAQAAGALGGKLTGAGGGGFMLLFVPPDQQARVIQAFPDLIHVPFEFETEGSRIIYYDPESEYRDR